MTPTLKPFPEPPKRRQERYLPTPDEIARRCAEIQAEWTPQERSRRRCKGTDEAAIEQAQLTRERRLAG